MFLGLDIGTSVIKAAIFDADGKQCEDAVERMPVSAAPLGWSELDGDVLWTKVVAVIRRLQRSAGFDCSEIRAIGVAGMMIGAWIIDENGQLLRPPILWNDTRACGIVDSMQASDQQLFSKIFSRSGSLMQLGCTLPLVKWIRDNEPTVLDRAKHIFCAKDYVRYRLTGEIATDESDAAMAPGSAVGRGFDLGQARLLGVEDFVHLLAPVARAETLAGVVTPAAASATGLATGTPVAIGAGDTASCVLGAGVHKPGQAVTVLGTSCLSGILYGHPVFEPKNIGHLFVTPGDRWLKAMVNVAGTTVLDWCLKALCPDIGIGNSPYENLETVALSSTPGSNGVAFIPYLSASGVISFRTEPRARAGFHGLAPHHGRPEIVRSIYEGIAYTIRDGFEELSSAGSPVRLGGGGARSAFWAQMIADVTGREVEVPEGSQLGAKGAALCAATAIGEYNNIAEACAETYRLERLHIPNPANRAGYDAGYSRYKSLKNAALGELLSATKSNSRRNKTSSLVVAGRAADKICEPIRH